MNISEAAKKAATPTLCITRETWGSDHACVVKPTSTPYCCLLIFTPIGKKDVYWAPNLDDLIADDWIVVDY